MSKKNVSQNRRAEIRTRTDRRGNLRTETFGRDDDTVAIFASTNPKNDSTRLVVANPGGSTFVLNGRTARTLYRLLQKHYQTTDKTW